MCRNSLLWCGEVLAFVSFFGTSTVQKVFLASWGTFHLDLQWREGAGHGHWSGTWPTQRHRNNRAWVRWASTGSARRSDP